MGDENPHSITPPGHTNRTCSLRLWKAETLGDNSEVLFQLVKIPSVPALIEVDNEAMRTNSLSPASESKLTNPT